MKLFAIVFSLFALVFSGIGVGMAWHQHSKITNAVAIQADVTGKRVERRESTDSDGDTSVSYAPIVDFTYEYEGLKYSGHDVFPMSMSSGKRWAHAAIAPFSVGQQVQAFTLPNKPHKAFLLRHYTFFPYIFILFPMIFLGVGLGIGLSSGASVKRPPIPVTRDGGWFEIWPKRSLAKRLRAYAILSAIWYGVGAIACGHYFVVARGDTERSAYIGALIYAALGCVLLGLLVYNTLLAMRVSDAQVYINAQTLHLGTPLTIAARQTFKRYQKVDKIEIGLLCKANTRTKSGSKTTYSTEKVYEAMQSAGAGRQVMPSETLEYATTTALPAAEHPSSAPDQKAYPRYRWSVRICIAIDNAPDYRADFPIRVLAALETQEAPSQASDQQIGSPAMPIPAS
ncbi:MAG: DUF3592 domain-containing protein [Kiritimatiellae bacterium]|nr:DUF3592 domain-containing protein [Kiritimatiellia bacterium]